MNERALHVLEFDKIRGLLSEKCVSEGGKAMALSLEPAESLYETERRQQETVEARSIAETAGGSPVLWFPDVSAA